MAERRLRPKSPNPGPSAVRRITSLTNPAVKQVRGLWLAKNRRASGLFLAEGLKLVMDAVDGGWPLRRLVFSGGREAAGRIEALASGCREGGGEVLEVSPAVLAKIARRDNPQTVIGVFEQRFRPAESIEPEPGSTWVALEEVRDPGNLGTIIRTADAVGAAGVILVGDTVDPYSVETVRATMGSIFHVPLVRSDHAGFAKLAEAWPGSTVGTQLAARQDYRRTDYRRPTLLVMGAERSGLNDKTAVLCSDLVRIPMVGRADSLNLAVATAAILFEIRRGELRLT